MLETEQLIRNTETLPEALFQEAVHYIDYLSPKAQSAYFAENWPSRKRGKQARCRWLDENDFWNEDD